jgi:hypothetical protein
MITNFEEGVKHAIAAVIKQGRVSIDDNGCCMYRGNFDTCCIVGHMIDDEFYYEGLETNSVSSSEVEEVLVSQYGELSTNQMLILSKLQSIHDSLDKVHINDFVKEFKNTIRLYNLIPKYCIEVLENIKEQ